MRNLQARYWIAALCIVCSNAFADMNMNDNPITTLLYVQSFEYRDNTGSHNTENSLVWDDARLRIGRDINKLELRSSGAVSDGRVESGRVALLYSRAVSRYWDLQAGWRHDFRPEPQRDWFTVGLSGLAPYMFHSDILLSVGRSGRVELDLEFERDYLITQRWVIAPKIEAKLSSQDDPETETGKGLSELELGLRLRYRISKKFSPYIGINWSGSFGDTADYIQSNGEDSKAWQWVIGFTGWY